MDSTIVDLIHKLTPESIDPNWVKAIVMKESSGVASCVRYEPNFRWLFKVEEYAKHPQISFATEFTTQKMSWGLGQIMGAVARERGHMGLMGELLKPDVNLQVMCKHIIYLKQISTDPADLFAMYNGGPGAIHKVNGRYSNQSYVNDVFAHLQNLKR